MRKVAIALLASLAVMPAHANDSTAELATGGLVFVRNDDIEMRAEDLFISTSEVRVRYRFFNKSQNDVTALVAFPMPEVKREESDIALPSDDPVNLLAFVTRADGKPVQADVEQRAFANGIDRTQLLRDLKIPLAPHLRPAEQALDRLPRGKWDELVRVGLAEIEESDFGKGAEKHLVPRWSLRTTFHWQQRFRAQKETVIEHRYKPSVGSSVMTSLGAGYAKAETWYSEMLRKYCVERDILNSLDRSRRASKSDDVPFGEERIEYILKTGANWSGPIKDFRLVVDKGRTDNLISFCGDGVKKIGPTQFEMRKRDFVPDGNFAVLILNRRQTR